MSSNSVTTSFLVKVPGVLVTSAIMGSHALCTTFLDSSIIEKFTVEVSWTAEASTVISLKLILGTRWGHAESSHGYSELRSVY